MSELSLRVLVVDDTVIYRKIVAGILARIPGVEVVGVAANGKIALQKIEQARPDLLTLDLEMPEMDGLALLQAMREKGHSAGAIMLSAITVQGANATVAALDSGAFDFVVKPSGSDMAENEAALERQLREKVEAFAATRCPLRVAPVYRPPAASRIRAAPLRPAAPPVRASDVIERMDRVRRVPVGRPEVVAVGISTGGPPALSRMLPLLPVSLGAAVLVVQHMPPKFTLSLANDLSTRCKLQVSEAVDGDFVRPGRILIAPGGRQMKVVRQTEDGSLVVRITDDPPENFCRPSVDYLFRSVAHTCGAAAVGVIMTGMGSDGTLGCRLLKRRGAAIIAQSASSCVVFGMPKQPVEEGLADAVLAPDEIANEIVRLAGREAIVCR